MKISSMELQIPFSPTYPADPRFFANRKELLSIFKGAVTRSVKTKNPTPDNIAVLGDWGIGKSSVLKKFEAIALEEFPNRRIFCGFVELMPVSCNSFSAFAEKVINDLERNFITQGSLVARLRNELKKWHADSIGMSGLLSVSRKKRQESSVSSFTDSLINLWKILEAMGVDTGIIMLDDLYYLAEYCPDVLYDLRGIFQGLPRHGCNFVLCCTGKIEMFPRIRELAEPLSRFFNIKYTLKPFSHDETREAILIPIKETGIGTNIEDAVIKEIHRMTAGHPFFIHFIMRELVVLYPNETITKESFRKGCDKIRKTMARDKFSMDYSVASNKERNVLRKAAKLSGDTFTPQDIKLQGTRDCLHRLMKKNLLTKHERGEYSLYHPLFREYLKTIE